MANTTSSSSSTSSDGENVAAVEARKRRAAEQRRTRRAELRLQRQESSSRHQEDDEDDEESERPVTAASRPTERNRNHNHNSSSSSSRMTVDTAIANAMAQAQATPIKPKPKQKRRSSKQPESSSHNNHNNNHNYNPLILIHKCWVSLTAIVRALIGQLVTGIACTAAMFPLLTILIMMGVSVVVCYMGITTHFELDLDIMEMFTPTTSLTPAHRDWAIYNAAGYRAMTPLTYINVQVIVHKDGHNVLEQHGIERLFDTLEVVESMNKYQELCGGDGDVNCEIQSMTRFWNHSQTLFEQQVSQDSDLYPYLDLETYPYDDTRVDLDTILGVHDTTTSSSSSSTKPPTAQALFLDINLPAARLRDERNLERFTNDLLQEIKALRKQFDTIDTPYHVEYTANYSIEDEFRTAIFADFPLIPVVLLVMVLFTVSVFWKCHRVESRFLLALGAVVTVFMSMAAGFGMMFLLGFPYGVINNILPFVIVGVGLDDTYIIHGAFTRTNTDPRKTIQERVHETFQQVGLGCFMTTATTCLALGLGCVSTIPAIRNLCYFAFPTILIDFVYQITLFVAIMVLDERRIQANRFDGCFCCVSKLESSRGHTGEEGEGTAAAFFGEGTAAASTPALPATTTPSTDEVEQEQDPSSFEDERRDSTALSHYEGEHDAFIYRMGERGMGWYANQLLRPWVKALVVLGFAAFTGVCIVNALRLKQDFSFFDLLPDYSMTKTYFRAKQAYGGINNDLLFVHFRDLNQSDPKVMDQMHDYMDQITALDYVEEAPFCWFRDVRLLQTNSSAFLDHYRKIPAAAAILEKNPAVISYLENQTAVFAKLSTKKIIQIVSTHYQLKLLYQPLVVFSHNTMDVKHSRCELDIKGLNHRDMQAQLDVNRAVNEITKNHPLNQDFDYDPLGFEGDYYHAFLYEDIFHLWDFFETALWELKVTAVTGIVVVSFFGFLFVPHWSAILYIFPLMCILYVDMLGLLHITGLSINVLTYVILVIAVGLLVDFIMHILLRFFEVEGRTKEERLRNTLKSMGTAILLGGISTFLGTIPLFFSDSYVFRTVCISIFSMVILGMVHGLILLPVLISIFGGCGSGNTGKGEGGESEDEDDLEIVPSPTNSSASTAMESPPGSPRTPISVEYIERGTRDNTFDQYEVEPSETSNEYEQVVDC